MKNYIPVLLILLCSTLFAQQKISTNISSVKVFKKNAEITRNTTIFIKQGTQEIILTGISSQINPSSLQVKMNDDNVQLLSAKYLLNYLSDDKTESPETIQLKERLEELDLELSWINDQEEILKGMEQVLNKNQDLGGSSQNFTPNQVIELSNAYKTKFLEIRKEIKTIKLQEKVFLLEQVKINKQLIEYNAKNSKPTGNIIIKLDSNINTDLSLSCTYIVNNAGWNPLYDIRSKGISSNVNLTYKAVVYQHTGLDWNNIDLTISTGNPSQNNNRPILNPLYANFSYGKGNVLQNLQGQAAGLNIAKSNGQPGVNSYVKIRGYSSINNNIETAFVVDGVFVDENYFKSINQNDIATFNVLKGAAATSIYGNRGKNGAFVVTTKNGSYEDISELTETKFQNNIILTNHQTTTEFAIVNKQNIINDNKENIVPLKTYELQTEYVYHTVPKLNEKAYLLAKISDWEQFNLEAGKANIFFEGAFIGNTNINPTITSKKMFISMGIDNSITVKREPIKEYQATKLIGSNKKITLGYELIIKNKKNEAINIEVLDQIPVSQNKAINVELVDKGNAEYNAEVGSLLWKMTIQPQKTNKERFLYSVKYPKKNSVSKLN